METKRWRAKEDEEYWFIDKDGKILWRYDGYYYDNDDKWLKSKIVK